MPDLDTLASFYPPDYHSMTGGGLLSDMRNSGRLRRLRSLVDRPSAAILDYGCGDGGFIKYAARQMRDWRFWGFEIAAETIRTTFLDGRVTIVTGQLSDLLSELPVCDLITMNHVIEHLPDPLSVLHRLQERLRNGGMLEGQTPAADSLERAVFGEMWSGFHAPRHTVIFSRAGLHHTFTRADFQDSEVTRAFNPAGIAVSLASATPGRRPGRIHRRGLGWLTCLCLAVALYPIDLVSGAPGIVNFVARKGTDSHAR